MSDEETLYFATPAELRRWFRKHHARATEQWIGFHKSHTKVPSITWPDLVDEALCVGWIDGLRQSVDEDRYRIRCTPRKATSKWSQRNVDRVAALEAEGRMTDAGRAAFAKLTKSRTGVYSYEQSKKAELEPEMRARFEADAAAWAWFQGRPPSYRGPATHWVLSAKQAPTRARRLDTLIECSREGRPIPTLSWTKKPTKKRKP
ncbi:MAG: YdeI/OmpD-associated family protein [Sandaracinaceae bacterium]|nr:YdeI/OmpD-associated family protein [Sandaracinaceae bacterium]